MCFSPQPRAFFQHQHFQKCFFASAVQIFDISTSMFLKILTSKCAFRHSRVHFFNISTYKSGPNTSCFVHFDFRMCLSPQPRAIFRHQNLQKCSKHVMFCNIFTSKCAFRHSGVQFFDISTYKSALGMRCFVHFHFRMCFSPQRRAIFDLSADHLTPHPPL